MKRAIIDASSAILLQKVGLFRHMARTVDLRMTRGVYEEVTVAHYPGAGVFKLVYQSGRTTDFNSPSIIDTPASGHHPPFPALHRGEKETIRGYLAGAADFIIIDDGKGAGFCRKHGIPYINALLCPKVLLFSGALDEKSCRRKMDDIIGIGRYSSAVIDVASRCVKSDLAFFLN